MKIIIKTDKPIRVYHHPIEVSVLPKSKLVRTYNENGSLLEEFNFLDKEIEYVEDYENDYTEIVVTLHVKE